MIKKFFLALGLAALMMLEMAGTPAVAQTAPAQCQSAEQFIAEVHDRAPDIKVLYLNGTALEAFATNMDKLSGGGHSSMDGIVMIDPATNKNDLTNLAIFRNHCFLGQVDVPTDMVKKALGLDI